MITRADKGAPLTETEYIDNLYALQDVIYYVGLDSYTLLVEPSMIPLGIQPAVSGRMELLLEEPYEIAEFRGHDHDGINSRLVQDGSVIDYMMRAGEITCLSHAEFNEIIFPQLDILYVVTI